MQGQKIGAIITALLSHVRTLEDFELQGANWNKDEDKIALVDFVAAALVLKRCDIANQTGNPIELVWQKAAVN